MKKQTTIESKDNSKKENYVEKSELESQVVDWQKTGTVSDALAQNLLKIAQHLLTMKQFRNYKHDLKEEMVQEAAVKCIKNLKNVKIGKGSIFSYFTHCCWSAFVTYLGKHYKRLNRQREMLRDAISALDDQSKNAYLLELERNLTETIERYSSDSDSDDEREIEG